MGEVGAELSRAMMHGRAKLCKVRIRRGMMDVNSGTTPKERVKSSWVERKRVR